MKQILSLTTLFEMSVASLSCLDAKLASEGGSNLQQKCQGIKKQIGEIEGSIERLQTLKNKVKRLDPNQESLNNIKLRISSSQLSLNLFSGDSSTRSSTDMRRSIATSFQIANPEAKDSHDLAEVD